MQKNIADSILGLYPDAIPLIDFIVVSDKDGERIAEWNLPGEPPDAAALQTGRMLGLRQRLRARINAWRDEQEAAAITFEHAGHTWDGGLRVRRRMQPVLTLTELPSGFFWTDANNEDVPMDLSGLAALHLAHEQALVAQGWAIHTRQRAMKEEIETLDEAALQDYEVGWPPA
ncbi:XkdW family protein [Chitinolyticbacter meiyuanensis]|uniref:XkdW family protein n=1 Tax=Chitinolyticbacter meiyuanensis TaxID=682798 RepID=UPI001FEC03DE|nr:XkdW family protein [Chitinolyticbacter meiyuanensis]